MTNKNKLEIDRWKEADFPGVWYFSNNSWFITDTPHWYNDKMYIVDDEHAELRKLQIKNPDTKFEILLGPVWQDCSPKDLWRIGYSYRVKND